MISQAELIYVHVLRDLYCMPHNELPQKTTVVIVGASELVTRQDSSYG